MEKIAVGTNCSQCLVLELLDKDLFYVASIVKSQVPVLHLVDNEKDKVFWQLSLISVTVSVRLAPVFLTFLVSKPGPAWRLTIQQVLQKYYVV